MIGVGPHGHFVVLSAAVVSNWIASCVVVVMDAATCLALRCWNGSTAGSSRFGGWNALWFEMAAGAQILGSLGASGQCVCGAQNNAHRSVVALIAGGIPSLSGGGKLSHAMVWIGQGDPSGRVALACWKVGHCHIVRSKDPKWL